MTKLSLQPLLPYAQEFLEETNNVHPSRARKKFRRELIQIDVSQFFWFGDWENHLHVAIDDASRGDIIGAYFDTQETSKPTTMTLNKYWIHMVSPFAF
ncbi:hypothetical protein CO204_10095 [Streptococcus mutans]|nr:hypothetical protein CO204_10095 [Streptococcus mutans]